MEQSKKITEFIKKKPYLIWYVKDLDSLSQESIIEHTLNYGNWDDVQELIQIMGIKKIAKIFNTQIKQKRINYNDKIKNFFVLYFNKYA